MYIPAEVVRANLHLDTRPVGVRLDAVPHLRVAYRVSGGREHAIEVALLGTHVDDPVLLQQLNNARALSSATE